jgi:periplasmic copper chaperone A
MKNLSTRRALLLGIATLSPTLAMAQTGSGPKVTEAWARPTVAGQQGGGGFMTLTGGAAPDRLLGARAAVAERMELHTMSMDGNVMRMREVPGIDVPAGGTVKLAPGGLHLMFMGLKQPLANGSTVPVTLRFEKAGEVVVDFKIQPRLPGAAAADPHAGHKH